MTDIGTGEAPITGRVLVTMTEVKLENRNLRAVQSQIEALRADSA